MENAQARVGVGVMVIRNGKVLMALRTTSHGANTYQFPGGHLEYLESFEDCARREVREECGIEIHNLEFTYIANMLAFAPKHFVHVGLAAEWKSGEAQQMEPEKSGPWNWFSFDELPRPLNIYAALHLRAIREQKTYFDALTSAVGESADAL